MQSKRFAMWWDVLKIPYCIVVLELALSWWVMGLTIFISYYCFRVSLEYPSASAKLVEATITSYSCDRSGLSLSKTCYLNLIFTNKFRFWSYSLQNSSRFCESPKWLHAQGSYFAGNHSHGGGHQLLSPTLAPLGHLNLFSS